MTKPNFEGHLHSECGEHRTVGPHRAWCFACSEWCYPDDGCKGCKVPKLEAEIAILRALASPIPMRNVRILLNNNVSMTPGKAAAQAVHAALMAYGIPHGSVVVLQGSKRKIEALDVQVHDAGLTELKPGTLTAGCSLEDRPEAD